MGQATQSFQLRENEFPHQVNRNLPRGRQIVDKPPSLLGLGSQPALDSPLQGPRSGRPSALGL